MTAITPEQLKNFLTRSGRRYITFKSTDLVTALAKHPEALNWFQEIVGLYGQERGSQMSDRVGTLKDSSGIPRSLPIAKSDALEPDELQELAAQTRQSYFALRPDDSEFTF